MLTDFRLDSLDILGQGEQVGVSLFLAIVFVFVLSDKFSSAEQIGPF